MLCYNLMPLFPKEILSGVEIICMTSKCEWYVYDFIKVTVCVRLHCVHETAATYPYDRDKTV